MPSSTRQRRATHCRCDRDDEPDQQRAEQEQLQRRAVEDEAESRPAVVEHHDLVDHRELEVRGRVVDRDAAVLDQHEDSRVSATSTRVGRAASQAAGVIAP